MKRITALLGFLLVTTGLFADVQDYLDRFPFQGVALIEKNGKVVFSQGEAHEAYQIGSITKTFVAIAVLRLQERGLVGLSDSVSKYFDAPNDAAVTVEQLLDHTSGIPDYFNEPLDFEALRHFAPEKHTLREVAELFVHRPLHFIPGSEYRYSNSNYILLALILEAVTGKNYEAVLEDEVLKPAGMAETGVAKNPAGVRVVPSDLAIDPETGRSPDLSFYASGDQTGDNVMPIAIRTP